MKKRLLVIIQTCYVVSLFFLKKQTIVIYVIFLVLSTANWSVAVGAV